MKHKTLRLIARKWKLKATTASNRQPDVHSWILGIFKCHVLSPECIQKLQLGASRAPGPVRTLGGAQNKTHAHPFFRAAVLKRPGGRPPSPVGGPGVGFRVHQILGLGGGEGRVHSLVTAAVEREGSKSYFSFFPPLMCRPWDIRLKREHSE
jgi:hypothetical protein